ncbi:hypothetical protein D1007_56775 [Hordeum vulgare]|nr:hypothetical protein D1007_56775 [Hordeum vulgare]
MPQQRRNPVYAVDSPDLEAWFAWEHEEQRRRGVCDVAAGPPLSLVVHEEDHEAEATYENTLAVVLHASEEEACLKEEEEEAYQKQLTEAIALSIVGDRHCHPHPPTQDRWS